MAYDEKGFCIKQTRCEWQVVVIYLYDEREVVEPLGSFPTRAAAEEALPSFGHVQEYDTGNGVTSRWVPHLAPNDTAYLSVRYDEIYLGD